MSALLPGGTADGGVKTMHVPSGCRYVSSYGNHSKINGCHESSMKKSPEEHSEEVKTSPSGIPPSLEKYPSLLPVCFLTKLLLNTDRNHHSFLVHVCVWSWKQPWSHWITYGNTCNELIMFSYSPFFLSHFLWCHWAYGLLVSSQGIVYLFPA